MNITRERLVIYTAIAGVMDVLHEPSHRLPGVDYVCFTDNPQLRSDIFSIRPLPFQEPYPQLTARHIKLIPHLLFPDHDISLWIDGSEQIVADITPLLAMALDGYDIAAPAELSRNCLYEEARCCLAGHRTGCEGLEEQVAFYRSEGVPENAGLAYTGILLRRHHVPAVKAAMELWWNEILHRSRRDQVSLPYVLRKSGLPLHLLAHEQWHDRFFITHGHRFYPDGDTRNRWQFRLARNISIRLRQVAGYRSWQLSRQLWRAINKPSSR